MDLTVTNTTITTTASVKTPEAETETPTRIQPSKPSSFSNGVLKRHPAVHHHFHHHHASFNNNNNHHHHPHATLLVTYKECLKNHAASLGGHAVDGCGEFMPSPTATPTDPTSLKCAACGCHRNFHRREPEEPLPPPNTTAALEYQPHHRHHPPPPLPPAQRSSGGHSSPSSPSPPPISSSYYPSAPHMLLALSAGLSGPPQDSNIPITPTANAGAAVTAGNSNGRKRYRTKFTPDQKEKMLDFAEKVGWKIQKRDEDLIAEFCNEIGVDKGVLKVWMHNNKNTFGKRDQANISSGGANSAAAGAAATTDNGNGMEFTIHYHHQNHENNNDNKNGSHNHELMHHSDSVSAHVVATNGSSSSS
ncbi:zinc-finger homeodomain protein 9-like [Coffea eugenioides]|uniref:Zinc-finger homeodomain protein 8-like n=1 Tax=Coffea arabica TaxID=13443 RepID=A0A6P6T9J6_COFAR|nr:zinc-finger homeodomain protein 9-like [Coffea arabica]XP_027151497.1 zinc-finger homeodomain protein 9-like [Coffea eugenioides]